MKHLFLSLLFAFGVSLACEAGGTITVGGKAYPVDTTAHYNVGPGTRYTQLSLMDNTYPLKVYFLEVDATNPNVKFKAETATDAMKGMEGISSIAKRKTTPGNAYIAGTNADFYNTSTGEPINGFTSLGEIGRMPINSRPVIATTSDKLPLLDIMTFNGVVTFGADKFNITNTNIGRGTNNLIIYNRFQGGKTETNTSGTEVLVELLSGDWGFNKELKAKVVEKQVGVGNMTVPAGKAVLSGHGTAQIFLNKLNVGDEILLDMGLKLSSEPTVNYDIKELVGGDRFILKNGEITDNDWAERHPRTSMGYSADKKKIYFCVVDGRSRYSAGVTTKILGELMKHAGAADAFNLDGGGSSGMYIKDYGIVNSPSDIVERRVSNGFFVVSTAPEDAEIASIGFMKDRFEMPTYGSMKPVVVGYNKYGQLISKDVAVTFSCPPELGEIDQSGNLLSAGVAIEAPLTASYNGLSVAAPVALKSEAEIALRLDSVLLDTKKSYTIELVGTLNGNQYPINPIALTWKASDPTVGRVADGVLTGLASGTTNIIGTLGTYSDTLKLRVQDIVENPYIQSTFENNPKFSFTESSENLQPVTLSNLNLPEGWNSGAKVSYTYTAGRFSELQMATKEVLYSLPDHLKFRLNTGEATFTNIKLSFKSNNDVVARTADFASPAVGEDLELSVDLNALYPEDDIAKYPLVLDNITFSLRDARHTKGKEYSIFLKDLQLNYTSYPTGIENVEAGQGSLVIYPNPAKTGEVTIVLPSEGNVAVKAEVFAISGQLVKVVDFGVPGSNEVRLPLHGLANGSYLVKITEGNAKAVVGKLIIAK